MKKYQLNITRFTLLLVVVNAFWLSIFSGIYYTNQDYFTEAFCVNKAKPELNCNGKCHLNKVTKSTNDDLQSKSVTVALSLFFVVSDFMLVYGFGFETLSLPKHLKSIGEPVPWVTSVFHPPSKL